ISAKNSAAAVLSLAGTIVWSSSIAIAQLQFEVFYRNSNQPLSDPPCQYYCREFGSDSVSISPIHAKEHSPPRRGGVDATSIKCCEASFYGADGVVRPAKVNIAPN